MTPRIIPSNKTTRQQPGQCIFWINFFPLIMPEYKCVKNPWCGTIWTNKQSQTTTNRCDGGKCGVQSSQCLYIAKALKAVTLKMVEPSAITQSISQRMKCYRLCNFIQPTATFYNKKKTTSNDRLAFCWLTVDCEVCAPKSGDGMRCYCCETCECVLFMTSFSKLKIVLVTQMICELALWLRNSKSEKKRKVFLSFIVHRCYY